jgi:hypothetical protein
MNAVLLHCLDALTNELWRFVYRDGLFDLLICRLNGWLTGQVFL